MKYLFALLFCVCIYPQHDYYLVPADTNLIKEMSSHYEQVILSPESDDSKWYVLEGINKKDEDFEIKCKDSKGKAYKKPEVKSNIEMDSALQKDTNFDNTTKSKVKAKKEEDKKK